jgi:hypothetical protein
MRRSSQAQEAQSQPPAASPDTLTGFHEDKLPWAHFPLGDAGHTSSTKAPPEWRRSGVEVVRRSDFLRRTLPPRPCLTVVPLMA